MKGEARSVFGSIRLRGFASPANAPTAAAAASNRRDFLEGATGSMGRVGVAKGGLNFGEAD